MGPANYNKKIQAKKYAAEQQRIRENQRLKEIEIKRRNLAAQGIVSCPRCASTTITALRTRPDTTAIGYSVARELIGSCDVVNVCQVCGQRFYPGV